MSDERLLRVEASAVAEVFRTTRDGQQVFKVVVRNLYSNEQVEVLYRHRYRPAIATAIRAATGQEFEP